MESKMDDQSKAAEIDRRIKKIRIQTGVVTRLTREKISYEDEVENQREKIKKFEDEGKDEYFLNYQDKVLKESIFMIGDTQKRLRKAYYDFKDILKKSEDLAETVEYKTAKKVLQTALPHITSVITAK